MTGQGPSSKEAVLTRHSGVGFFNDFSIAGEKYTHTQKKKNRSTLSRNQRFIRSGDWRRMKLSTLLLHRGQFLGVWSFHWVGMKQGLNGGTTVII